MPIPLARIKVERDGHVILDGSSATLPRLKKALLALRKTKGRVRYYREGSRSEASAGAPRTVKAPGGNVTWT